MKTYQRTRLLLLVLLMELTVWSAWQAKQLYAPPAPAPVPVSRALPPAAPQPTPAAEPLSTVLALPLDSQSSLEKWDEKIFKGKTHYTVRQEGGAPYLNVVSENAASGLFYELREEADDKLVLSWRWRAKKFPPKRLPEVLSAKNQDDFAARVYVIFVAPNLFRSDCIEYVWDDRIPAGTVAESPYSDRIQLYVIRSGPAPADADGWVSEQRDLRKDFIKLFGREPSRPVGAIALMSDSDNTQTAAEADFADIELKRRS